MAQAGFKEWARRGGRKRRGTGWFARLALHLALQLIRLRDQKVRIVHWADDVSRTAAAT